MPIGGGLIKAAWYRPYAPSELPETFDQIAQSWDTANKADKLNDPSVCITAGIKGSHVYILDVVSGRLIYPDLRRKLLELRLIYRPNVILIEDKSSGTPLVQDLKADGIHQAQACTPQGDKSVRCNAQTAIIANGFVHVPEQAPWLVSFVHETTSFPFARHDDQVDALTQLLEWFSALRYREGQGWMDYIHQEMGLIEPPARNRIRVQSPVGRTTAEMPSGAVLETDDDGVVQVSETRQRTC